MKKYYLFSLLLFLLVSCQEYPIYYDNRSIITIKDSSCIMEDLQTKAKTVMVDEPFVFLSETDFNKWSHIDRLEDRFMACDIPESQLKIMTTEALVKSILHYPLNYLIFAYNDPLQAIDIIMKHSSLHKELVKRPDVANAILKSFEITEMSLEETIVSKDYQTLSYSDEMFLEYYISSKYVKGFSNPELKEKLKKVVEIKIAERENNDKYSIHSILPLIYICKKEGLRIMNIALFYNQEALRSTYIYTCFGHAIIAENYPEFSAYEINARTNYFVSEYDEAELISPASARYNCHSYAWYDSSTSNTFWIHEIGINQLFNFWTQDLFSPCTLESDAEVVHYPNSDHSAIRLSSGNYISKWGPGPLMEHAPDYGPYEDMTTRDYYRVRQDLPLNQIQISGNTIVYSDQANNYIRSTFINRPVSYSWSVQYWGGTTSSYSFQQLVPDEYQLICYDYGVYTIRVDSYYKGINVFYGELNVNCVPEGF